jgi:hypothetical protein
MRLEEYRRRNAAAPGRCRFNEVVPWNSTDCTTSYLDL